MNPTSMVPTAEPVPTELDLALTEADIHEIQYPVARDGQQEPPGEEAYDAQILAGLVAL